MDRLDLEFCMEKKKWLEELPPYQGGGGMIKEVKKDRITYGDLPNKYEAGTMATAQVIAFDKSIKFLESIGTVSYTHLTLPTSYPV